ncbi:nuclear speckle splicing regulatory protein 1 [Phtheirospermum japonicum]|uniref:Nuclear speckle splicing regulatory protein 1 n=1 Tax=Phtheirospermum japonicum TaxID=374723 RepID=A0A830D258_9LAMI|nr:nuclear speckle splicing regulatory protein 1 [Phtheirospermum japonicum]
MKKYGLQLRVQPQQKKQPARPPLPTPLGFNNDDDDDNVERDILRQAYKNKTHKDVEEQHKKALEEDPSAFDYDGVYDKMKAKQVRPVQQDRQDRKVLSLIWDSTEPSGKKAESHLFLLLRTRNGELHPHTSPWFDILPRYIQALMDKAKQREKEHEVIYERKLAKERSKDEDIYADKDKFVTSAYKKKLAEQAKWLEEERIREMREEKDDVTKKTDISDFYFNLGKNVAFGATEADARKPEKQPNEPTVKPPVQASHAATSESSTIMEKSNQYNDDDNDDNDDDNDGNDDDDKNHSPDEKSDRPYTTSVSKTPTQDQVVDEPLASNQSIPGDQKKSDDVAKDHHKRSEDAVAAAKARFLARKKAKV